MSIDLIKTEITTDPLVRGYAAMTDLAVADSLNTVNRSRNKTLLTSAEILEVIDLTELLALTSDQATRVWGILGMEEVNPFGVASDIFVDAFSGGSATITALAVLRVESVSRATELGFLGTVKEGHIQQARM